jgi:hypothetical protein
VACGSDCLLAMVVLRFQLPHAALAELYRADLSTVIRAIHEVRPFPARAIAAHPASWAVCALSGPATWRLAWSRSP